MPLMKLTFKPGVNRDIPNYTGEGGWFECDKVRFRQGLPQKLGGWKKRTPVTFYGVCRQLWDWVTTFSDELLALGTNSKLYIVVGGNFSDITPLRDSAPTMASPNTNNAVSVTSGSRTVRFDLAVPHGMSTGDFVVISGVVGPIGGIPASQINTNTPVTVISATAFSFTVSTAASSTVTSAGGTAISLAFETPVGNAVTTSGLGWGVGTWGRDFWGLGASTAPVFLPQRDWWFNNFDNDLVGNIRDGQGYWWTRGSAVDPSLALSTKAIRLRDYASSEGFDPNAVPSKIMQLLVSQQDRHLIAFGAVPFGSTSPSDFDSLLIRWASQDQPGQWTPQITNSAGDIRLSRGSKIVRALSTRQEILVWTDTTLYALQFLGTTDVFGVQEYATGITIASPRAVATASDVVYWMGRDKFYTYSGRVQTLPCTLLDHVFDNLNRVQADQIVSGTNEEWNEVWWFYPTADSSVNNAYVVYNYLENLWYYGTIERTAWLSASLDGRPLATNTPLSPNDPGFSPTGNLFVHEEGVDDDVQPMVSFIRSNDIDLDDGYQFMLTRRIIPDIKFSRSEIDSPEVFMEVFSRNFPGNGFRTDPADTQRVAGQLVGRFTNQVFLRARARQMALKIESTGLGVNWQLGAPRVEVRPDGRR